MPSWIGPWEIIIVIVIALLLFGPRRLPELGSSLGKAITGFKKGLKESEEEIRKAVAHDETDDEAAGAAKPAVTAAAKEEEKV
jgi:sec-independent protein translocase protein TatA